MGPLGLAIDRPQSSPYLGLSPCTRIQHLVPLSIYIYACMSPTEHDLYERNTVHEWEGKEGFRFLAPELFPTRGYSSSLHITLHHQRQRHTIDLLQRASHTPHTGGVVTNTATATTCRPFSLRFFPTPRKTLRHCRAPLSGWPGYDGLMGMPCQK